MMDYLNISGKTAIVTGGARGIGKSIAEELAQFGVAVILADVKKEEGQDVEKSIIYAGGKAKYIYCDVSDDNNIHSLVGETIEHFGGVDILVNDAGIGAYEKPFEEISNDEWDHMMAVDLTGVFKVCREVVPYMKKKRWGKIVNISSGSGIIGCEFCSHYATAKAGLIGFTQSIAKELASWHINANAIAVPTTETEMLAETGFDEKIEDVVRNVPWGRIGRPKDIADMVLYLSSDASEYVTGQILAPNGGLRTPI